MQRSRHSICQQTSTDERKIKEKEIETENKTSSTKKNKVDVFEEFANEHLEYGPELLKALRDFEVMRKETKHPMSEVAKDRLLAKLKKFPEAEWIPVLEQSILHSWQDLYPLKEPTAQPKYAPKKKQYSTAEEYVTMSPKSIDVEALEKVKTMMATWGVKDCTTSV